MTDRELDRLLADEIEARLSLLRREEEGESLETGELRAAIHSLRSATALAGHVELSILLAQLSSRLRQGDPVARAHLYELLEPTVERLRSGLLPLTTQWPTPPKGLMAAPIDERYRTDYAESARRGLSDLDTALASFSDPGAALDLAYRAAHAIKGAASSVGDDVTAWFCHGLENALRSAPREGPGAQEALVELTRHRTRLALLLEDAAAGLETLRQLTEVDPGPVVPASRGRSSATSLPPAPTLSEGFELRVPMAAVNRAAENLMGLDGAGDELRALAELASRGASRLRMLRLQLLELPREASWDGSISAAVEEVARDIGSVALTSERGGILLRRTVGQLYDTTREVRDELRELRTTRAEHLFERCTRGVQERAALEDKAVDIEFVGAETTIDRPVADALAEAVTQLVRNAVAHGIESRGARLKAGKPERGHLELRARRIAGQLRIDVIDDGRGVDLEALGRTARSRGVDPQQAVQQRDAELLTLLVVPGMTTRLEADLMAGRGLGLELAQESVRRLGGSLTLQSRPLQGFVSVIEVPLVGVETTLLWVRAGSTTFAVPAAQTGTIELASRRTPDVALGRLLHSPGDSGGEDHLSDSHPGEAAEVEPGYSLDLRVEGLPPLRVGLERVGTTEDRVVHPLPAPLRDAGPFVGAVRRGDGSLRLVLDVSDVITRGRELLGLRG